MDTTRRNVFGSAAFIIGIAQSAASVALVVAAIRVVPEFEKIFKDFNTPLPAATCVLITVTQFLCCYWYLLVPAVLLWPFVNWAVVSVLSPRPEVVLPRLLWYLVTWAIPLLVLMFGVCALFQPLLMLISNLSSSSGPAVQ